MTAPARAAHLRLGRRGENLTARLYRVLGCDILARNWRTRVGELDLIVRDGDELVFVEVKSMRIKPGYFAAGNLSFRQRRRNRNAAKLYLRMLGRPHRIGRFCLAEVTFSRRGHLMTLRRYENYLPPLVPGCWT